MSLIKLSGENPDMNVTDAMVRDFLVSSQQHLNAATNPDTPEADFRVNCALAQLEGLVALLLVELKSLDQGTAADVAWQVHDFCQDGEPLAGWVAQELTDRGIDVEAMIREQQAKEIICQDCNLPVDESPGRRDTRHDHCGPLPHTGPVGGPYCERCS